jgi:hypothetical protein
MIEYPTGLTSQVSDEDVHLSFRPSPNYAALAEAAAGTDHGEANSDAWMKGVRARTVGELRDALEEAKSHLGDGKGMLIEVLI